jgi:D-arabinose 1-dehydrogenase-like Zn-dependent alcohol dehydrogenase
MRSTWLRNRGTGSLPDVLTPTEAAPILCVGITTFNSLRHSGARAGDLVAVQGLRGLGHLDVPFANKTGFHTVLSDAAGIEPCSP